MIKVGDRLPEGSFRIKQDDGSVEQRSVDDLFGGQKVVLVGVPGAFTSTCHNSHVPQFLSNLSDLKARGADRVVVLSVNDHHVMRSWGEALDAIGRIDFIADGSADYTRALGLDKDMVGMGVRSQRFSALVEDGVVKTLNFEAEGASGIDATGAATMLGQL